MASPREVLALPMGVNDAKATTVGDYLIRLLLTLWEQEDGFSGKRPFGNSGWQWDLIIPLIHSGAIKGSLDSDGYIDECDEPAGRAVIIEAIKALGHDSPEVPHA